MAKLNQREIARLFRRSRLELKEARANAKHLSWSDQLDVWRRGFVARQALLFDFEKLGFESYISERGRKRKLPRLNRDDSLFADKLFSFLYFRQIGTPTPEVYAFMEGTKLVPLDQSLIGEDLPALVRRYGKVVLKPRGGAHGRGVFLVEQVDDKILANGREVADVTSHVAGQMIVTEHLEQHSYSRKIYPGSLNTLRVISLRRHDNGEPFVAAALHRFGSDRSKPVDNLERGGLSARVDVETGELGPLAAMPGSYLPHGVPVAWLETHPDSGSSVAGTVVPRWTEIVAEVNRTMALLPGFNWIGWDVAVTDDGFSFIEGNTGPGITFQVHGPILRDDRVRALFDAHGILPSQPGRSI